MYRFKLADGKDMVEISKIIKFDLNLKENPRFYIMTKDNSLLTFVLVNHRNGNNYIDYVYLNNLNEDEVDFFYRSLVYNLEDNTSLFSKYNHHPYTLIADDNLYRVVIPKGSSCGR